MNVIWQGRSNIHEEYVKQVEVKQSDDISAEVDEEKNIDVISR